MITISSSEQCSLKDSPLPLSAGRTATPAAMAGGSLCARSLAALEASSPYMSMPSSPTASCSGRSQCSITGESSSAFTASTDSDKDTAKHKTLGKGNPAERILRALTQYSISSDKSTDEAGSSSEDDASSWIHPGSSTEDGATSDSDAAGDEPLPAAADSACLAIYPIAILLQLRTAALRARSPGAVRYSTRRAADLPPQYRQAPAHSPASAVSPGLTAWAPQRRRGGAAEEGANGDDAQVARVARSLLNKLTLEKFDTLYEQIATCGVRTPSQVTILMREIFEKATAQHHFIAMYTDLCVRLEADPRIAAAAETDGKSTFRRLLLNQCQIAFEELLEPRPTARSEGGCSSSDDEEAQLKMKQKALGNVKFVGQLLVRGMLSSKLLCSCAEQLLSSREVCPEALESLAVLLTVAGPAFDNSNFPLRPHLEGIFARVRETVGDTKVPARVRFLLRDLLDLRAAGWPSQARTAAKVAGPMRLAEVAAEATEASKAPTRACKGGATTPPTTPADRRLVEKRLTSLQEIVKAKPAAEHAQEPPAKQSPSSLKTTLSKAAAAGAGAASPKPLAAPLAQGPAAVASPAGGSGAAAAGGQKRASGAHRRAAHAAAVASGKAVPQTEPVPVSPTSVAAAPATSAAPEAPPVSPAAPSAATPPMTAPPAKEQALAEAPVAPAPAAAAAPPAFNAAAFHRELSAAFRDLGTDRNVAAAVRRVRACAVPPKYQAREFADILTRAAEESRGPARRSAFAFAAGLCAASDGSAFLKAECLAGVRLFFQDVYEGLCEEIPRLPAIAAAEVLPTLRTVLPASNLAALLPPGLRVHSLLPEDIRNAAAAA